MYKNSKFQKYSFSELAKMDYSTMTNDEIIEHYHVMGDKNPLWLVLKIIAVIWVLLFIFVSLIHWLAFLVI